MAIERVHIKLADGQHIRRASIKNEAAKQDIAAFFAANSGSWGRQQKNRTIRSFSLIVKGSGRTISVDPDAGWIGYYGPNAVLDHEDIDHDAAGRYTAAMLTLCPREGDDVRYPDYRETPPC